MIVAQRAPGPAPTGKPRRQGAGAFFVRPGLSYWITIAGGWITSDGGLRYTPAAGAGTA